MIYAEFIVCASLWKPVLEIGSYSSKIYISYVYIYKSYFIHIVYISPRMFLRVQNVVIPAGGPDQWLEKAYSTQSELMDFARWLEESFESDERLVV